MDEQSYQTIIAILDQRGSRRLWFTLHLLVFIAATFLFGGTIQRAVPLLQDGNLLFNIWPLLVIAHFLYMCVRDLQGRLLRRSIEQGAKAQVATYPQKRKNSRLM